MRLYSYACKLWNDTNMSSIIYRRVIYMRVLHVFTDIRSGFGHQSIAITRRIKLPVCRFVILAFCIFFLGAYVSVLWFRLSARAVRPDDLIRSDPALSTRAHAVSLLPNSLGKNVCMLSNTDTSRDHSESKSNSLRESDEFCSEVNVCE